MRVLAPNPVHIQLQSDWKYTKSDKTDIRKTFKRERERLLAEQNKPSKIREFKTK